MKASRRFQPGDGPSRGLLHDCTTSPINRLIATYTLQIFPIKTSSRVGSGSGQEPGQAEDTFLPPREIIVEQGGRNLSFFSNFFPPRGEMTRCRVQSGLICSGIVEQSHSNLELSTKPARSFTEQLIRIYSKLNSRGV